MKAFVGFFFAVFDSSGFAQQDTTRIDSLNDIAWGEIRENLDSSRKLARAVLNDAQIQNYPKGVLKASITIASTYFIQNQFDSANSLYRQALKLAESLDSKKVQASVHNNLGALYRGKGLYTLSIEHYQKSFALKEKIRADSCSIINSYINIGNVFVSLEEFRKAIQVFEQGVTLGKTQDCISMKSLFIGLGVAYYNLNIIDSALSTFSNVDINNSNYLRSIVLNNEGLCYLKKNELENALDKFQQALIINRDSLDSQEGIISNKLNLGKVYALKKNFEQAEKYTLEALVQIESGIFPEQYLDAMENLSEIKSLKGNWKEAYKYALQAAELKDSLRNITLDQTQNGYFAVLQVSEKERELEGTKLKLRNESLAMTAEQQKNKTMSLITFLLGGITILSLGFLFLFFRQKEKIKHQNKTILEYERKYLQSLNRTIQVANDHGKRESLDLREVVYIEKAGENDKVGKNSIVIHTALGTHSKKKQSIKRIESELEQTSFVRVDIGTIVNLHFITSVNLEESEIEVEVSEWNRSNERLEKQQKTFVLPKNGKIRQEFEKKSADFLAKTPEKASFKSPL